MRTLLWLAALAAAVYIGTLFVRPQIRAWRFKDAMQQTARFAQTGERSEGDLHAVVMAAAEDLEVPLASRRLVISRDRTGAVHFAASWEEPVVIRLGGLAEWVDTLHFAYEVPSAEP